MGFYPTMDEVDLLGGESRAMYPRRGAGLYEENGPDTGSLTASGIWHQDEEPQDNFYERYDRFFSPLDNTLGLFAPRELALLESSDEPSQDSLYGFVDAGFPLTRSYNPDLAMLKAGPLHLDLLTLSGTVLYSDYEGDQAPAQDDGWLSVVQLSFRGIMQLTDNLYLSATGQVYYLPETGDVGFFFGGGQNTFMRLAYEAVYKDWEITVYDEFRVYHRLSDILDEVEHDEINQAGRYRFGRFSDNRSTDYFDGDSIYSINKVGATAARELNEWWRVGLGISHTDFWNTLDFEDHRSWDRFNARLDYDGQDWRFAPYLEYNLTAVDEFDTRFHTVYLGASGLISENLRTQGKVGYMHSDGAVSVDRFLGDGSLTHYITSSTSHSLSGGVTQSILDEGDNWLATYGRYTIRQDLGARVRASAFTQYSDLESLDVDGTDRIGWSYGANLSASVSDYTNIALGVAWDEWDSVTLGQPSLDISRTIYRATLTQQLAPYLHARLMYQYEDFDSSGPGDFDEHLYMFTITHVF